ncbi:MAG: hypothetical protein JJU16_01760 [Alkalibacterium sp.]|nr:hypothetical protein [Alkalibacterium sp.]
MPVIVKRKDSIQSQMIKLKIKCDGKVVGKINSGEAEMIYPKRNQSVLSVTEFISSSNEILVEDGDIIEIQAKLWPLWYFIIISVLSVFLRSTLLNTYSTWMMTLLLAVLYLVPIKLFKTYRLIKLPDLNETHNSKE